MICTIPDSIEIGDIEIVFDVKVGAEPGEPMVMYYRDGSGYPGCPPSCELIDVDVRGLDVSEEVRSVINSLLYDRLDSEWEDREGKYLEYLNEHERE